MKSFRINLAIPFLLVVFGAGQCSGEAHAGIFSLGMPGNPAIQKAARVNACYNVQDADARTMCLARAHREPGQCYSIQRADLRAQCLAEVQR
jgi:hypothetical protein